MANADANRTGLRYVAETTWGTTPATPTMQALRFTGESLDHNVNTVKSNEIRDDRNISDLIAVSMANAGGFNFELSYGTFDDILESVFFNAWNANVLKNGITQKSFSIERAHLDINQYFLFPGMVANTFNLDITAEQIVTGSVDFMGKTCALAQASAATSVTDATTTTPFNATTNVGTLKEGGVALSGVYLKSIKLTINNNLRGKPAISHDGMIEIGVGECSVSGSIEAYFANEALWDKYKAGTASALEFTLTDLATNSYKFELPNLKYSAAKINSSGKNQDVMASMTFEGLYDSSDKASIVLTRTPHA